MLPAVRQLMWRGAFYVGALSAYSSLTD
jgi:hypothetical protein